MQAQTTTTVIDFSRINKVIAGQQRRVAQMQEFLELRGNKLQAATAAIEKLLGENKLAEPMYANAYSTHWGEEEYSHEADMLLDCAAVFTTDVKNMELFKKRLTERWMAAISQPHGVNLDRIILHPDGKTAELKLRVRP